VRLVAHSRETVTLSIGTVCELLSACLSDSVVGVRFSREEGNDYDSGASGDGGVVTVPRSRLTSTVMMVLQNRD
jgi:hypothetical protein